MIGGTVNTQIGSIVVPEGDFGSLRREAASYSTPTVIFGSDWATATVGTTVTVGRGITAYASFTSEVAQSNVVDYGGQVGMNVALNVPAVPAWVN